MLNYKTKLYKMKKIALICAAAAAVVLLSSAKKDDDIMTKENGAYIINTTELGKQVDGYVGPTPLKVYIRKNKIEKKGAVLTQMSKFWFDMTSDILPNHMISADVKDMPEFFQNVKLAIEYYEKNK